MLRIMVLMFMIIGTTLAGIAIIAVLAMSQSPSTGGTPLSEMGTMIAMATAGALVVALPISYVVAGMISRTMKS